jgi:hypothetical protein
MHVLMTANMPVYGTDIVDKSTAIGRIHISDKHFVLELPDYGVWTGKTLSDLRADTESYGTVYLTDIRPITDPFLIGQMCSCSECERSVIGHGLGLAPVP